MNDNERNISIEKAFESALKEKNSAPEKIKNILIEYELSEDFACTVSSQLYGLLISVNYSNIKQSAKMRKKDDELFEKIRIANDKLQFEGTKIKFDKELFIPKESVQKHLGKVLPALGFGVEKEDVDQFLQALDKYVNDTKKRNERRNKSEKRLKAGNEGTYDPCYKFARYAEPIIESAGITKKDKIAKIIFEIIKTINIYSNIPKDHESIRQHLRDKNS